MPGALARHLQPGRADDRGQVVDGGRKVLIDNNIVELVPVPHLVDRARELASAGYITLIYTARGFGASGGRIHLDDPDFEVADARSPAVVFGSGCREPDDEPVVHDHLEPLSGQ